MIDKTSVNLYMKREKKRDFMTHPYTYNSMKNRAPLFLAILEKKSKKNYF